MVCRAVARLQQALSGSVVFPFKIAPDNEKCSFDILFAKQALKARKCIPTYMVSPFFSNGITITFRHGPQIIHIYMDERRRRFIDFWNQPHGWKYFLVEFGFWGCCGFPVRLRVRERRFEHRSWNASFRSTRARARVVPASWTRTVAVVCTSRSRPTGASESFSVSVVIRTVLVDHRRGDVHRSP